MKDYRRRDFLTSVGVALAASILIGFAAPTMGAEEKECPYAGQKLTPEKLKPILQAHATWVKDWTGKGKAVLCNADLSNAKLQGANLWLAILQGANLNSANLQGADLRGAILQEANLGNANLQGADLRTAVLQGAYLGGANLQEAHLSYADLRRAELINAKLQGADLSIAFMQGADLDGANLKGAKLIDANLQGADLSGANLKNANLEAADLSGAKFQTADLRGANLQFSKLAGATFPGAKLSNASFLGVDLRGSEIFEPRVPEDFPEGLVNVREKFKKAGDREQERYLTFLIKRNERRTAPVSKSAFGYILFELTSDWGYAPGRPLSILGWLILGFWLVYLYPIGRSPAHSGKGGIYQVWPEGRLVEDAGATEDLALADEALVSRLYKTKILQVLLYSLYFSVLSAFHIGWRDLNVGNWIVRLQPREYTLRPRGWVRVVSGIQSLLSVYLLALWALVYFGRPFE